MSSGWPGIFTTYLSSYGKACRLGIRNPLDTSCFLIDFHWYFASESYPLSPNGDSDISGYCPFGYRQLRIFNKPDIFDHSSLSACSITNSQNFFLMHEHAHQSSPFCDSLIDGAASKLRPRPSDVIVKYKNNFNFPCHARYLSCFPWITITSTHR